MTIVIGYWILPLLFSIICCIPYFYNYGKDDGSFGIINLMMFFLGIIGSLLGWIVYLSVRLWIG